MGLFTACVAAASLLAAALIANFAKAQNPNLTCEEVQTIAVEAEEVFDRTLELMSAAGALAQEAATHPDREEALALYDDYVNEYTSVVGPNRSDAIYDVRRLCGDAIAEEIMAGSATLENPVVFWTPDPALCLAGVGFSVYFGVQGVVFGIMNALAGVETDSLPYYMTWGYLLAMGDFAGSIDCLFPRR